MPQFVRAYPPSQPAPGSALWLIFQGGELLLEPQGEELALPRGEAARMGGLLLSDSLYLGTWEGMPCLACELGEGAEPPPGWRALGMRAVLSTQSEDAASVAGYAAQMLHWRRTSRFCPVCAHETEPKEGDWGRHCPQCGYDRYPHVSPAVLVLVHDGDRILLAHKAGWGAMYSILAGFVEPGETLEECVHREVAEEVGITVTDLVYGGSQSWPFPHQLMVGFTARYAGGDIKADEAELDDAVWFERGALPDLPSPISLSRRLIDTWIENVRD